MFLRFFLLFFVTSLSVQYTYYKAYDTIGITTPSREEFQTLDSDTTIKNGYYYSFSQNRDTLIHCFYVNNKKNGPYNLYYDHGLLKYSVQYKNNFKIDTAYYYEESGAIIAKEIYTPVPIKTNPTNTYTYYQYFNKGNQLTKTCFLLNDIPVPTPNITRMEKLKYTLRLQKAFVTGTLAVILKMEWCLKKVPTKMMN
jgi:hypothetical protein